MVQNTNLPFLFNLIVSVTYSEITNYPPRAENNRFRSSSTPINASLATPSHPIPIFASPLSLLPFPTRSLLSSDPSPPHLRLPKKCAFRFYDALSTTVMVGVDQVR